MDWLAFNLELVERYAGPRRFIALDPSYLSKSGKHPAGVGYFHSGVAGKRKWGLEVTGLAAVDLENKTAYHLEAVQTVGRLSDQESLLDYYADIIQERKDELLQVSKYVVADSYFSRNPFIRRIVGAGFYLISRLRKNVCLRYFFTGKQKQKGCRKKFAGKVDLRALDQEVFSKIEALSSADTAVFSGVVELKAGRLTPCFKTIADFRARHPKQLKKVLREYVLLLKEWDLIGGERIAVDGTKIHADNARKKNFNAAKLQRHLDRIDKNIEAELAEMDRIDREERGKKRERLRARTQDAVDVLKARQADYTQLQKQLKQSDDTQISLTDPDARALIKHGRESLVGYNVQSVVDADNMLILHTEATNENDINALGALVDDVHNNIGLTESAEVLADKGYHNATELSKVQALGHRTFVAERKPAPQKGDNYSPDHFCYDPGHDAYICPAGKLLTSTGKLYQRKGTEHRFQTYRASRKDCKACPLRTECLSSRALNNNGTRAITRLEHPFGTLKRHWTGYYTLLRGKEKVDGEFSLLACCYNLRRSMSIFGVSEPIERLKGRFSLIFSVFAVWYAVDDEVITRWCQTGWGRREPGVEMMV